MNEPCPMVLLGEVLKERQELPSDDALIKGEIRIVEKIGFKEGRIQLRNDNQTKTGMILIKPGDLVVSGINAAKGAIAIYGEDNNSPIAATIHYGAYIPDKSKVEVKFLWLLLRSGTFRDLLNEYVPGGIKTELKAKRLLSIPVPLPVLEEQRRIMARIEEQAARIDEVRELRRRAVEETEALIKSYYKILFDKISLDGRLSDVLLEKPKNGWSANCDNAENGIPILTLSAVTGFRYRENEFKRTSEETSADAHYWLNKGDLLITRSNTPELVGHAAIYNGSPTPCIYPDLIMRLKVNEKQADTNFVHSWLKSSSVRQYIAKVAKGTSPTMKKISQKTVMDIPFPIQLTIQEQRRIVAYLDDLQTKADALKLLQNETTAELDALMPSILDRAFRGEL